MPKSRSCVRIAVIARPAPPTGCAVAPGWSARNAARTSFRRATRIGGTEAPAPARALHARFRVVEPGAGGRRLTIRLTMSVRGDTMTSLRTCVLALLPVLAMTVETAPAGFETAGCGVQAIDPGLRAAFARFEQNQSRGAARI